MHTYTYSNKCSRAIYIIYVCVGIWYLCMCHVCISVWVYVHVFIYATDSHTAQCINIYNICMYVHRLVWISAAAIMFMCMLLYMDMDMHAWYVLIALHLCQEDMFAGIPESKRPPYRWSVHPTSHLRTPRHTTPHALPSHLSPLSLWNGTRAT